MKISRARLLGIALVSVIGAMTAENVRAGVSTESPFALRGQAAASKPQETSNSPIEFRGVISDENGQRFALYDPAKKEGIWVSLDSKDSPKESPYVVRSYDTATSRLIVDYQGKSQTLTLSEPKFGPGKTVAMMPGPGAGIGQPSIGGARPGFAQPNQPPMQEPPRVNADQAQRLEAIRQEVARRRAQREQAAQAAQQGGQ